MKIIIKKRDPMVPRAPETVRRPRLRWALQEEEALKSGVYKHGAGKWRDILKDPEFGPRFHSSRTNVDLKDKWRTMTGNTTSCRQRKRSKNALDQSVDIKGYESQFYKKRSNNALDQSVDVRKGYESQFYKKRSNNALDQSVYMFRDYERSEQFYNKPSKNALNQSVDMRKGYEWKFYDEPRNKALDQSVDMRKGYEQSEFYDEPSKKALDQSVRKGYEQSERFYDEPSNKALDQSVDVIEEDYEISDSEWSQLLYKDMDLI